MSTELLETCRGFK